MSTPPPPFGLHSNGWPFEPQDLMNRVPAEQRPHVGGVLFWLGSWPLIVLGSTVIASLLAGLLAGANGADDPNTLVRTYYVLSYNFV